MTTTPSPHTFTFTGQAHGGLVPDERVLLVLDTNAVSALQAVVAKGIRPGDADAARVAHLLRWLHDRPDAAVSVLFGVLEGSGLHEGVLRPLGLLQRGAMATGLIAWGRDNPEPFIASARPPPELFFAESTVDPASTLEAAELLLPWTTLPCWALVALVWQARRRGLTGVHGLSWIGEQLATRLDFVPSPGWLACTLLLVGKPQLRKALEEQVFKFGRDQPSRDIPSAAWDLGYLGFLSIARSHALSELLDGRTPVLVSADRGLVRLAHALPAEGNSGIFGIESDQLDEALASEAIAVLERLQRDRIRRWPEVSPPTWQACAALINQLHSELGLEQLGLERPTSTTVFKVRPQDIMLWLNVLEAEQGKQALARLVEVVDGGHDPGPAAVVLLNRLIEDNAEAHGRSRDDSWRAVRSALPEETRESRMLHATVRLAIAAGEGRWAASSAWSGIIATFGVGDVAELWLWYLTREVLRNTAAARGATVADLLVTLRGKLEAYLAEFPPG